MVSKNKKQKGFITTIILIVIGLIILQFVFGFNIAEKLHSPKVTATIEYIKKFLQKL